MVRDLGLVNVSIAEASTDTENQHYIGSLIGYNQGTVKYSYATGTFVSVRDTSGVNNQMGVGGLVGASSGVITNSYTDVDISGQIYVGGLVGMLLDGTVSYCHTTGSVSGSWAGGLVGKGSGTITNSYATGEAKSGAHLGGLVGHLTGGTITDSFAAGVLNSGSFYLGGLVGVTDAGTSITNCYATKDITSQWGDTSGLAGGLVGVNNGAIENSWASGNITTITSSGGLVGMNYGTITASHATGNVTGSRAEAAFGGLVGENFGKIEKSWASGNVSNLAYMSRGDQGNIPDGVGGLVGTNNEQATIINSQAYGDVIITGGTWQSDWGGVGALAGSNSGNVIGSSATGSVIGTGSNVGGLIGGNFSYGAYEGTVTNSTYHDVKAEAAAAQQAAWENSANIQGGQTTGQALYQQDGQSQTAYSGTNTSGRQQPSSVGSGIVFVDSDSYSATIRSINVEGTEYGLEDDKK
jgi:hypothetical protein